MTPENTARRISLPLGGSLAVTPGVDPINNEANASGNVYVVVSGCSYSAKVNQHQKQLHKLAHTLAKEVMLVIFTVKSGRNNESINTSRNATFLASRKWVGLTC